MQVQKAIPWITSSKLSNQKKVDQFTEVRLASFLNNIKMYLSDKAVHCENDPLTEEIILVKGQLDHKYNF